MRDLVTRPAAQSYRASRDSRARGAGLSCVTTALAALLTIAVLATPASAQDNACKLAADDRNPSEQILRCGENLVVRPAPGTQYHPVEQNNATPPSALQLDSGALIIEFNPSDTQKNFQILTPEAIAAVRGTRWAMEVRHGRTSVLVLSGQVAVGHAGAKPTALIGPGEGADVSSSSGRIVVKHWKKKRVRALLARFGE